MASHRRDQILHGHDHSDTHASDNRWRHQESSSFARHAAQVAAANNASAANPANAARPAGTVSARRADERNSSKDLADFLNSTRVEPPKSSGSGSSRHTPIVIPGNAYTGGGVYSQRTTWGGYIGGDGTSQGTYQALEVRCGPLLNYRRMEEEIWHGSVMVITKGGGPEVESDIVPELHLKLAAGIRTALANKSSTDATGISQSHEDVVNGSQLNSGQGATSSDHPVTNGTQQNGVTSAIKTPEDFRSKGTILYSDPDNTFWRFDVKVPMQQNEARCDYEIYGLSFLDQKKTGKQSFFIPGASESMRIMFYSCNGFSVGTDEEAWSGPALWNDVLRIHSKTPFHVMLGGGDQIYNDSIRVSGPLRQWTDVRNPKKRKDYAFPETLRKECDEFYVNNYIRWYSTEPFASANGQIPQLNIWDDHDIIDGFGSYTDDFMKCHVFRGIIGPAHKYYLLFQHHLAPPLSSFTTDGPETGVDTRQLKHTYVLKEDTIDPSYIIGQTPGPYVAERSRSIYTRLGARIAFFGIDARTERTRHQVNYPETYALIFDRLHKELAAAASGASPINHLIVLLGIPIAYPRLSWLENIFTSPLIGPLKFLNKRFGFGGGFFNHFDGNVDLLDDLDDHYTARTHKKERLYILHQLQALAAEFSVRISILGGDVHLAAVGRFYSNLKLNIPIDNDHRYMANIISSAIVNKPPPQAVANLLAKRNKIHHLDEETDETLMCMFNKDPGVVSKSAKSNHVTMPSRNWAMITENRSDGMADANATNGHAHTNGDGVNGVVANAAHMDSPPKDGHSWLHPGEVDAGTKHKAADLEQHGKGTDGSLDVSIRVEKDQHDKAGQTQGYGMTIPKLIYRGAAKKSLSKEDETPDAASEAFNKSGAEI